MVRGEVLAQEQVRRLAGDQRAAEGVGASAELGGACSCGGGGGGDGRHIV